MLIMSFNTSRTNSPFFNDAEDQKFNRHFNFMRRFSFIFIGAVMVMMVTFFILMMTGAINMNYSYSYQVGNGSYSEEYTVGDGN